MIRPVQCGEAGCLFKISTGTDEAKLYAKIQALVELRFAARPDVKRFHVIDATRRQECVGPATHVHLILSEKIRCHHYSCNHCQKCCTFDHEFLLCSRQDHTCRITRSMHPS